MIDDLEFALAFERLDEGAPEEKACFGLFGIRFRESELLGGVDHYSNAYRAGPMVSGYHVAEWLAWNWWRLLSEPRTSATDWWRAHNMTAIGEGYAWPNLTIYSDGVRTVLHSRASKRADAKPFRYLGAQPVILPSTHFESAIDDFVGRILARLRETGIIESNLTKVWSEVLAERKDPATAKRRKLEALLGRDPDAFEGRDLEKLIQDARQLGESAVEELAAESGQSNRIYTSETIKDLASRLGQDASPRSVARLHSVGDLKPSGDIPAWVLGSRAARRLREQERLGDGRITDKTLSRLAGLSDQAIDRTDCAPISFVLEDGQDRGKIVFRARVKDGRRFEAARLLGDRLTVGGQDRLRAATRAYTYRQRMQRAFAAEFLSPFESVEAFLNGDYSDEAQEEAAKHFGVSPRAILTLLVNHGRLERDELEAEVASAA